MLIPGWRFFGAGLLVLAVASGGCGLMPSMGSGIELIVKNHTNADAVFKIVEYDFVADEPGPEIVRAMGPLGPGSTVTADMAIPGVESWALLVNDIVAVTSLGVADSRRAMPGDGPLVFHISVYDGALEVSTSRSEGGAGVTAAPVDRP